MTEIPFISSDNYGTVVIYIAVEDLFNTNEQNMSIF